MLLPRNKSKLLKYFPNTKIEEHNKVHKILSNNRLHNSIKLRYYQAAPYTTLLKVLDTYKDIMFKANTGFGKSIIISKLMVDIGYKTLILVDRGLLKSQLTDTIQSTTKLIVGDVSNTDDSVEYDVYITTFQYAMRNLEKVKALDVSMLIVDEAHTVPATRFSKVLHSINRLYTVLFTATPSRSDGLDEMLSDNYSYIVTGSNPDVKVPKIYVYRYNSTIYNLSQGVYITELENNILKDKILLKDIINTCIKCKKVGRKFILATHTQKLQEYFKEVLSKIKIECTIINSKNKVTSTLHDDLLNHKVDGVIGFGSIFKGFDEDTLDTLVHVSGAGNKENIEQLVGRILRVNPSKREPIVFDFFLRGNLEVQQDTRLRFYHKSNYQVKYIERKLDE
jgi:superfamily II DNA or RNA helicase